MFGLDLHPAVVHFPIALGVVGAVMELLYFILRRPWARWFGPILLTLALAGSGAAYFSGESVKDKAQDQGAPQEAVEKHETTCIWALGALGLATLLSWAVRPTGRGLWLSSLIALAAAGLTVYTGYLGAELVYLHGAGRVKAAVHHAKPGIGIAVSRQTRP
jgi:uncharacterized membrane protein